MTTEYAKTILIEKQMSESKFREKTIQDLDNENLTQNEKIQKISKRCKREELINIRKIDRIKRDKILENINTETNNQIFKEKEIKHCLG